MNRSALRGAVPGVIALAAVLLLFVALFSKDKISTALNRGDTIRAQFAEDYKLRPDVSVVKVGFVKVGVISGVERNEDGTAEVSMKVDGDVLEVLGSEPSATIRSTTLLGGSYFVDLQAGGDPGAFTADSIPLERTDVPVELDRVARALQPSALEGMQGTLDLTRRTFDERGQTALRRLMASAPGTLAPAATVLEAAQGDSSDDLTHIVTGLESASRVLTENEGQLDGILTDLRATSSVLAASRGDLDTTLAALPEALGNADRGLTALDGTLATVRDVAGDLRDPVQALDGALEAVGPVLADARPVVTDARALLADANPLVADLVPAVGSADHVLEDLEGPVLDDLNGPVKDWLYEAFVGEEGGEYAMTSSERPLYEEIVFTFVNLNRAATLSDANGHAVGFQPGIGTGTVGGLPISLEQLVKGLTSGAYSDRPIETIPPFTLPSGVPAGPSSTDAGPDAATQAALVADIQGKLSGFLGGTP